MIDESLAIMCWALDVQDPEGWLKRDDPALMAITSSITSTDIVPFVRQFVEVDRICFDAQPLHSLKAWLSDHLTSDLFGGIMHRVERWSKGDRPTIVSGAEHTEEIVEFG